MKILIKEGIVKKMVNRVLGYDLSKHIESITDWEQTNTWTKMVFNQNYKGFNIYLNAFGPIYFFDIDGYNVVTQFRDGRWLIVGGKGGNYQDISEDEFLDKLGIGFMGVKLQQVIDEFIEE